MPDSDFIKGDDFQSDIRCAMSEELDTAVVAVQDMAKSIERALTDTHSSIDF